MKQFIFHLIVCFIFSCHVYSAQAEVFKWVDDNGQIHYSDKKPELQQTETIKIKPHYQETTTDNVKPNVESSAQLPTATTTNTYQKKHAVTMYVASWCGFCKQARAYFKKNNIKYTEYDIETNASAQKRYEKLGGVGVPLIVANRQQMQGFSVTQFERWYGSL